MSIGLVMASSHLILCCPLLPPSIFPSIRVFSSESALRIRWPKHWSFSFSISPSNEYSGLISFRMNWLDLLVGIRIILISEILKHERNVHFTPETIEQIVLRLKRVLLCKKFRKWSNSHHYLTLASFSHWALRIHFLVSIWDRDKCSWQFSELTAVRFWDVGERSVPLFAQLCHWLGRMLLDLILLTEGRTRREFSAWQFSAGQGCRHVGQSTFSSVSGVPDGFSSWLRAAG